MHTPHSPQHPERPRSSRTMLWLITGLAGIICVLLAVLLGVAVSNRDTVPGPPGPGIATHDGQEKQADPAHQELATNYTGTSINRTAEQMGLDGKGSITLRFTDKTPNTLRGQIEVRGRYVGGTGLFDGKFESGRIELTVHPTDGTPNYQFIGTVAADGSMSGALAVPGSANTYTQSGEWSLNPVQ